MSVISKHICECDNCGKEYNYIRNTYCPHCGKNCILNDSSDEEDISYKLKEGFSLNNDDVD